MQTVSKRQRHEDSDDDSVAQPGEEPGNSYTVAFVACTWHIAQMQEKPKQRELKEVIREIVKADVDTFSLLFPRTQFCSPKAMKDIEAWIKEYLAEMDLSAGGLDRNIFANNVVTFVLRNVMDSPGQPSKHQHFVFEMKGNGMNFCLPRAARHLLCFVTPAQAQAV